MEMIPAPEGMWNRTSEMSESTGTLVMSSVWVCVRPGVPYNPLPVVGQIKILINRASSATKN